MQIRSATEADIPLLRDLAQRIWCACYPGIIAPEQIEFMLGRMYSEDEIRRQLAAKIPWKIVELDGSPIGFLSWQREDDGRVKSASSTFCRSSSAADSEGKCSRTSASRHARSAHRPCGCK